MAGSVVLILFGIGGDERKGIRPLRNDCRGNDAALGVRAEWRLKIEAV
jgi:hypothetical protein